MYGPHDSDHPAASRSAEVIVPMVVELINPRTALDVGCGSGGWVSAFLRHGVETIGIDGPHLPLDTLKVDQSRLVVLDLCRPFDLGRPFDLVLSLEVAEHLPEEAADSFVGSVVRHAGVILFSAAIPGQGGEHHVNEQWQSYWAGKFRVHGYHPVDFFRYRIWEHPDVACWYAQNTLLYVSAEDADRLGAAANQLPLDVVHPGVWSVAREDVEAARAVLFP